MRTTFTPHSHNPLAAARRRAPGRHRVVAPSLQLSDAAASSVFRAVRLRGPIGSEVTLTLRRGGNEKPAEVSMKRAAPNITPVAAHLEGGNIGYIRIPGFDAGTLGMRVGETRIVEIPSAEGYGDTANGPIPANSTLIFVLTLQSISDGGSAA